MEWFQIDWKKYSSLKTAQNKTDADNYGVYAIYEADKKSLNKVLYIGETYTQTFSKRLKQHKKDWLHRYEDINMCISFGVIRLPKGRKISQPIVFDCEGILIYHLIPPCNTSGKKRYTGRDIIVINTGNVGLMPSVVTNDKDFITLLRKHI